MNGINSRRQGTSQHFWGEIAPCEHIVQIYEDDQDFFDALTGFVSEGLASFEGVIVIARNEHLNILEQSLARHDVDIEQARRENRYIARDADEVLAKFLVNGWPDRDLFRKTVTDLLTLAKGPGRKVRAFGEMVSLLWERGHTGATVNLEHLWHEMIEQEGFPLLCAYPKSGTTQLSADSFKEICDAHSTVLKDKSTFLIPPSSNLRGTVLN